jgi:Heterokaryon incompatibility protein (HET)
MSLRELPRRVQGSILRIEKRYLLLRFRAVGTTQSFSPLVRGKHLELFSRVNPVWMNQKDDKEKALQIRLIKSISGLAIFVIIYLGVPQTTTPNDGYAVLLRSLANIPPMHTGGWAYLDPSRDWTALSEFWKQPLSTRSWIIQEAVLAKNGITLYGDESDFASCSLETIGTMELASRGPCDVYRTY